MEEIVNSAVTRQYTYGLQRISENQFVNNAWTVSFYGYDGGGNVRQLTNSVGAVTDTYEYDAFGNEVNHTGTTPNNYLYRGEQYDPDLGLYYLRARYYNPATGRFLSRDPEDPNMERPKDPKTLHKYLYVGGNPVNKIDPLARGLFDTSTLTFRVLTITVTAVFALEPIIYDLLACTAEEVHHSSSQTPVFRPFSGLPCVVEEEPKHDDWPNAMPSSSPKEQLGAPHFPSGPEETGEAP
jgi:RHS repeat-associated protein